MRVALDAMGGDHAPEAPIVGALMAVTERPQLEVMLVGSWHKVPNAWQAKVRQTPRITWVEASEIIEMTEAPVQAVRQKSNSSLVRTIELVASGEAEAAISAGNTGALMAAGVFRLGRLAGVDRPALSAVLPTFGSWGVLMLDVGANLHPTPQQLYQYGVMGALYCQEVYRIASPRVALMNVGTEKEKGPPWVKDAYQLLERDASLNFVGNIEPRELLRGLADVAVIDGFSGNIALKAVEGVARDLFQEVREALTADWMGRVAGVFARRQLVRLKKRWDYQDQGGAPLLGLNHLVYKCHGSSEARAHASTLVRAYDYLERHAHDRMRVRMGAEIKEGRG